MIKVVYIHGLGGSGNGSSSKNLKQLLEKKFPGDFSFAANTYDHLQPKESFTQIQKDVHGADLIIASSLGSFYASALSFSKTSNVKVILLNPCLEPKKYIPGLLWEEQKKFYDEERCFKEWDEITDYWNADDKSLHNHFAAIFATEDEFFHCQDIFRQNFKSDFECNLAEISGKHEIAKNSETLENAINAAFKLFEINK